ncbi:MAG: FHA domain-containing protein [Candidatus Bathyarchaeia archaeon]
MECPICHSYGEFALDKLGDKQILKCRACGRKFEYSVKMEIYPKLVFERGDREPFSYELNENGNFIIGRDPYDYDYVKIRVEHLHDFEGGCNTFIRNRCVSKEHAMIVVYEECKLIYENNVSKILIKKKCLIRDLGSTFGTSINGEFLKPNMMRELKNNDKIILSPNSDLPLVLFYKE